MTIKVKHQPSAAALVCKNGLGHEWERQGDFSKVGGVTRATCKGCGAWGWKEDTAEYAAAYGKCYRPYAAPGGGLIFKPAKHWRVVSLQEVDARSGALAGRGHGPDREW